MKPLKGRRGTTIVHVLNISAIVALGGVTQPDVHPENVSFPHHLRAFETGKDWACLQRDDTWNDKTPVSVCQAWSLSD